MFSIHGSLRREIHDFDEGNLTVIRLAQSQFILFDFCIYIGEIRQLLAFVAEIRLHQIDAFDLHLNPCRLFVECFRFCIIHDTAGHGGKNKRAHQNNLHRKPKYPRLSPRVPLTRGHRSNTSVFQPLYKYSFILSVLYQFILFFPQLSISHMPTSDFPESPSLRRKPASGSGSSVSDSIRKCRPDIPAGTCILPPFPERNALRSGPPANGS